MSPDRISMEVIMTLSDKIRNLSLSAGIDVIGFADASPFSGYAWTKSKRRDPHLTMADAKSIIVVGIYIGGLTLPEWNKAEYGRLSRLYMSGFFLDVIKPLDTIIQFLGNEGYKTEVSNSSSGESSILPLKLSAIRAGFGWQGKNSLLVTKKFGTFLALGGIITDAVLDYNREEESNKCGNCNICQNSCPLGALDSTYKLNVDCCLSNILQEKIYPDNARLVAQNRIGDCEICQDICPWNKKHIKQPLKTKITENFNRKIKVLQNRFLLSELAGMTEQEYIVKIGKYGTEIPFSIFHRNVLVAMNNMKKGLE
jgi:epoxyqueuosine reductase